MPVCLLCASTEFRAWKKMGAVRCSRCASMPRTRAAWMLATDVAKVGPQSRMAHFAPEKRMATRLSTLIGSGYEAFDLCPERWETKDVKVQRFDLLHDLPTLPNDTYDVVMHNHVLEHLPTNYALVLMALHSKVKLGGFHIFSFPIYNGHYRADFSPSLSDSERETRFGQRDHVHRFGTKDFHLTVGSMFGITSNYSLTNLLPRDALLQNAVYESNWVIGGGTVFCVRRT